VQPSDAALAPPTAPEDDEIDDPRFTHMPDKGRSNVARSVAISGGAQAIKVALQFANLIVLSRILSPSDFGLVAMVAPITALVALVQDIGLSQGVVQRAHLTHKVANSAFWINSGMSLAVCALFAVGTPLIGMFYGEPRVVAIALVTTLALWVTSFASIHLAILSRTMRFGAVALVDIVSAAVGFAATLYVAFRLRSYWALPLGTLITALVLVTMAWLLLGWRPSRPKRLVRVDDLVRFGLGVTGFNLANYVARNLDNILIGKRWGSLQLGLYDRAYKILLFPIQQVNAPVARVMLPALSRLQTDEDKYVSLYVNCSTFLLVALQPGILFMVMSSELLTNVVLGDKWQGAAAIFSALGIASIAQPLNNTSGWLFLSQGRSKEYMQWGLFTAATSAIAFVIGLPHGAIGVAMSYAISELLRTPLLWAFVCSSGPVRIRKMLPVFQIGVICSLTSFLAIAIIQHVDLRIPPIYDLAVTAAASYLASVVGIMLTKHGRTTIGGVATSMIKRFT
jgi:PST family polysaccharide transporter